MSILDDYLAADIQGRPLTQEQYDRLCKWEAVDAASSLSSMTFTYLVQAHDGAGWNAWIARNDQGAPVFTFNRPAPLSRLAAENLYSDALRTCGGTIRVVEA